MKSLSEMSDEELIENYNPTALKEAEQRFMNEGERYLEASNVLLYRARELIKVSGVYISAAREQQRNADRINRLLNPSRWNLLRRISNFFKR